MRKSLLLLGLLLVSSSSVARASLVDEVDKLTPEEAYLFQQKLSAKILQPVPEGFFTHLSVTVSGGVAVYDPSSFNSYLAPNQAKISTSGFWKMNLMWKMPDHFLMGFSTSMSSIQQIHEPSPNVFHRLSVVAPTADFAFGYRADLSESVFLAPSVGVGAIVALVNEETTTDATKTTYELDYGGASFHLAVELPIYYRFNRVWSIGLTNGFQLANITRLERKEDHGAGVPNLSLTGYQGLLSLAFNL